jgi:hypothetical protein
MGSEKHRAATSLHSAVTITIIVYAAMLSMQKSVGISEPCRSMADWTMKQKASCMLDIAVGSTHFALGALAAMVRIGKVDTAAPMPPAMLTQTL